MAKLYAEAVRRGERTLESVPARWREKVREILEGEA